MASRTPAKRKATADTAKEKLHLKLCCAVRQVEVTGAP